MFATGQRVWHIDGTRSGTVLECVGGRVYIEQDNGAELDFPARDLSATAPAAHAAKSTDSRGMPASGQALPPRALTPRDITPEHLRVLSVIPVRTLQAIAALFERAPGAGKFSALDHAAKLNAVAGITAVPYRVMQQYSDRPGELGLLMGKGIADRTRAV